MKKNILFVILTLLFYGLYSQEISIYKTGDSKDEITKDLGNPIKTLQSNDKKNEYVIWKNDDIYWIFNFYESTLISEPIKLDELLQSFLELQSAFTSVSDYEDNETTKFNADTSTASKKTGIVDSSLLNQIQITVLECKIYESKYNTKRNIGFRLKIKNCSDKEITDLTIKSYYYDKNGNIFFEDTKYPINKYSDIKTLKPNYSFLYPEEGSYYTVNAIDIDEWDPGKADFVVTEVTTK